MNADGAEATIAGILARGYDLHIRAHGPDGSYAVRSEGGRYLVERKSDGAGVSYVKRGGVLYAVNVSRVAEPCIHPGVFATERSFELCPTCGASVPRAEL